MGKTQLKTYTTFNLQVKIIKGTLIGKAQLKVYTIFHPQVEVIKRTPIVQQGCSKQL